MTNTKALEDAIRRAGLKKRYVVDSLGISYQAFLNKSRNVTEFNARELRILRKILNLSNDEWEAIFFASDVD